MSILHNRRHSTKLRPSIIVWTSLVTLLAVVPLAGFLGAVTPDSADTVKEELPAPDQLVPVDTHPELVHQQTPDYPEEAEGAGLEGDVFIQALVDKQGNVREAQVRQSSGHEILDQAALDAAYLNKYKPAAREGKTVAIWIDYKVTFVIESEKVDSDSI